MRVLFVITSLNTGGAEKLVVDLIPRLSDNGIQVDLAIFNKRDTPLMKRLEKSKACKIFKLGDSYYDIRHILRLRHIMKAYDIIHTHNSSPQLFAAIANIGMHKILVTTEHNTSNRKRSKLILRYLDRWMYKKYNKIICISDKATENLIEYLGTNDRILTIYNGIDLNEYYKASPIEGIHGERFVILMVAAFRPQKDQDTLVRAISRLPKDKYEVWFAGEGVRMTEVQDLVKKQGVVNQVKFLKNRTDIPQLLKTADVIVMSTHYEGLSLSNIEGMSAGKPFIASDVDGVREITKEYGVLFPHKDDKDLAEIILRLSQDKGYYNEIASRCYERAKEYDIQKTVKGYLHVYEELLS